MYYCLPCAMVKQIQQGLSWAQLQHDNRKCSKCGLTARVRPASPANSDVLITSRDLCPDCWEHMPDKNHDHADQIQLEYHPEEPCDSCGDPATRTVYHLRNRDS